MYAMRVDYDDHQHRVYSRARTPTAENARRWAGVFARFVPQGATVIDIGAGTGAYSRLLAEELGATVVAVEPSDRMRAAAERDNPHPRVRYVAARAEALPVDDAWADAALLSHVLHHIGDREAAVTELRRGLKPGGVALVRGSLRDRVEAVPHFRYFPDAVEIARRQFPSTAEVTDLFSAGGFELAASEALIQAAAPSLAEFAETLALRAVSTLELLDDDAFEAGMRRLRAAAAAETEPKPVLEPMGLLVFRRPV